jgi:hypothetical protein
MAKRVKKSLKKGYLTIFGLKSRTVPKGKIIIDSVKNVFLFIHKNKLKLMKGSRHETN